TQHRLHMAVAGAAFLPDEIELEIRIRGRDRLEPLEREWAQERPAEVGVKHDALRVDDGPQGERPRAPRPLHDALGQELDRRRGGPLADDADALLIERLPDERGQAGPRDAVDFRLPREPTEELVDRRQAAQRRRAFSAHRVRPRPSAGRGRPPPGPRGATPGPSIFPHPIAARAAPRPPQAPPRAPPDPRSKVPGRATRESTRRRGPR